MLINRKSKMLMKNCTFYNNDFELQTADIEITDGIITRIGTIKGKGRDMSGMTILPGFVDIHIHGGGGGDASDGTTEALDKMSAYLAKKGVTSFCPTTMTLPVEKLVEIVGNIEKYASDKASGAKIAGINLEGPFISPEKCGAQNRDHIIGGNKQDYDNIFNASKGLLKIITIAPEAFDSNDLIKHISSNITAAIGHSNANAQQCKQAIKSGASHITHLYNAMTPMSHREAGIVGTALDSDVTCELICDGKHICPAVLRNTFRILGRDRAVVISDSMRGAGLGNGVYELGGQTTYVRNGYKVAKLEDGTIAASITNLFDEYKNLLSYGVDNVSALRACTINPARVIGMDDSIGSIEVGKCADMIVCDRDMNIKEVYIDGTLY